MAKTSKDKILDYLKQERVKGILEIETSTIANVLEIQRTNVSSTLNQLVNEGLVMKTNTRPVLYSLPLELGDQDPFQKLVGYDGSLSNAIQLAKAAILYPSKSLNSLIIGSSGTGKSYLANIMFDYAKKMGKVSQNSELVKVNCGHFVNNPNELVVNLFGKPRDTGFISYFDVAQDSVLFIDNIDLLDGTSLAKVNSFIEKGYYHYSDGSKAQPKNVTLIIAINRKANPEITQLLCSKISVIVDLQDLKLRPLEERFELINGFFGKEARNTQHDIQIQPDVLQALLLVDSPLNLKYLHGVIKVAVANAYLRCYDQGLGTIQVDINDFQREVADALLYLKANQVAINEAVPSSFNYIYSKDGQLKHVDVVESDFYDFLNKKIRILQNQQLDKKQIDKILSNEINVLVDSFKKEIRRSEINFDQLAKIVDPMIIDTVTNFIQQCSIELNVEYPNSVVYGLCLHLNSITKHKRGAKVISVEKINEVKAHYEQEFALAQNLANQLEMIYGEALLIDEVVVITMFIMQDEEKQDNTNPQILIAMHGESAAQSIANVVNDLVKLNNTHAYDMSLQKNSETAYKELKKLIGEIDQGRGVIVIYDMGSLKMMLDRISLEIENEIRTIYVPITLIGIEASRKASMDHSIDTVYHGILSSMHKELYPSMPAKMAIITLCQTGEGGALEMKEYLQKNFISDIKIYALSISDRRKLIKEVQKIRRFYDIKAFVGTYNPKLFGIPFIPVSKIFESSNKEFEKLIHLTSQPRDVDFEQMVDYLSSESNLDKEKAKKALPELIDLIDEIYDLNIDQQVGLFLHIGALIGRLVNKLPLTHKPSSLNIDFRSEEVKQMKDFLSKTEKIFKVIIPDNEIATIFEIIKKENENG